MMKKYFFCSLLLCGISECFAEQVTLKVTNQTNFYLKIKQNEVINEVIDDQIIAPQQTADVKIFKDAKLSCVISLDKEKIDNPNDHLIVTLDNTDTEELTIFSDFDDKELKVTVYGIDFRLLTTIIFIPTEEGLDCSESEKGDEEDFLWSSYVKSFFCGCFRDCLKFDLSKKKN